jgi:hypothetical protein
MLDSRVPQCGYRSYVRGDACRSVALVESARCPEHTLFQ